MFDRVLNTPLPLNLDFTEIMVENKIWRESRENMFFFKKMTVSAR